MSAYKLNIYQDSVVGKNRSGEGTALAILDCTYVIREHIDTYSIHSTLSNVSGDYLQGILKIKIRKLPLRLDQSRIVWLLLKLW
jgi:hypothetical protein